jgi:hypothetical protein
MSNCYCHPGKAGGSPLVIDIVVFCLIGDRMDITLSNSLALFVAAGLFAGPLSAPVYPMLLSSFLPVRVREMGVNQSPGILVAFDGARRI